jgi:hypothetical protein
MDTNTLVLLSAFIVLVVLYVVRRRSRIRE